MFKKATPNLMVNSVNETLTYYRDILGFELVMSVPEKGVFNWAMVKRDDVALMFQSIASIEEDVPGLTGKEPGGAFTIFIEIDGIDELYQERKDKLDIVVPLKTTFYNMKEFTFRDINGYFITLAEPDQ